MVSQIIEKRENKLMELVMLEKKWVDSKNKLHNSLPYIPVLSQKLRRELKRHNIKTVFKS